MNFYEFFAGGGMARLGLAGWDCVFANDADPAKTQIYRRNFKDARLLQKDIGKIELGDLPGRADLAWASSPCQDWSAAGKGTGMAGQRSGLWERFARLMGELRDDGRAPAMIVVENVPRLITANDGADIAAILDDLAALGYWFGPLVIDAADFVPQSRQRLFLIAVRDGLTAPRQLTRKGPRRFGHPKALRDLHARLKPPGWVWWELGVRPRRETPLEAFLDETAADWLSPEDVERKLKQMSDAHRAQVEAARNAGIPVVAFGYARTRKAADGLKTTRMEVRFDGVAGCIRRDGGGASRQYAFFIDAGGIRARQMTGREAATLMGMPADYALPKTEAQAYDLAGDGVVVPVVRFLSERLLMPLAAANRLDGAPTALRRKGGRPRTRPERPLTAAERSAARRERLRQQGFKRMTVEAPPRAAPAHAALAALARWAHETGGAASSPEAAHLRQALDRALAALFGPLAAPVAPSAAGRRTPAQDAA